MDNIVLKQGQTPPEGKLMLIKDNLCIWYKRKRYKTKTAQYKEERRIKRWILYKFGTVRDNTQTEKRPINWIIKPFSLGGIEGKYHNTFRSEGIYCSGCGKEIVTKRLYTTEDGTRVYCCSCVRGKNKKKRVPMHVRLFGLDKQYLQVHHPLKVIRR